MVNKPLSLKKALFLGVYTLGRVGWPVMMMAILMIYVDDSISIFVVWSKIGIVYSFFDSKDVYFDYRWL